MSYKFSLLIAGCALSSLADILNPVSSRLKENVWKEIYYVILILIYTNGKVKFSSASLTILNITWFVIHCLSNKMLFCIFSLSYNPLLGKYIVYTYTHNFASFLFLQILMLRKFTHAWWESHTLKYLVYSSFQKSRKLRRLSLNQKYLETCFYPIKILLIRIKETEYL